MNKIAELKNISTEINTEHEIVVNACKSAVEHAIKAGELLIKAKSMVNHGEWLDWMKDNCEMTERTAQTYMRLAREYPKLEDSKAQRVADLSMRETLKVLAAPKESESELERARLSTDEYEKLRDEIQLLGYAFRQTEEIIDREEKIAALRMIVEKGKQFQANAVENRLRAEREMGRLIMELKDDGFIPEDINA